MILLTTIICFLGTSRSGKTTTIEYLVNNLSKLGVKIGSVKHIHHTDFSMDTKGTDTWRHTQAGTTVTIAVAPKEVVTIRKRNTSKYGLDQVIGLFGKERLDAIFIEGFHGKVAKRRDIAKIIVAKDKQDLEMRLEGTTPPILAVCGLAAKEKEDLPDLKVPIVDLTVEGDRLLKIVKDYIFCSKCQAK